MIYFLLKSTHIDKHFGMLDFEKRFISSGENITSIWTFCKLQDMELNVTLITGNAISPSGRHF